MNIVFDKKTLKVVSVFNHFVDNDPTEALRKMFPSNWNSLSIWTIGKDVNQPAIFLRVQIDKDGLPDTLLFKNKVVFKYTEEEKKKSLEKRLEREGQTLLNLLPKTLRHSMSKDIIELWARSPFTKPEIASSMRTMRYFFDNRTFPVMWWGMFTNAGGYANMNRSIVYRLHNHHVIPKPEHVPSINQISPWAQHYLYKMAKMDFRRLRKYPKIYGLGPQPQPPHSGRRIFYTMMETDSLHPTFRDMCNLYSEEVWVPSKHNQRLFLEGGVKKPVKLIPLGIDETVYRGITDTDIGVVKDPILWFDILGKPKAQGINTFKFLTLFGWSYRKGIDILIKSFVKAFKGSDDVVLLIASTHVGPDIVLRDTLKYAREIRTSDYPQILFYPHVTPEPEMPKIYKNGHVFLHTSRGEGFSLPQIEAAACNLPVISCNNTGMSQYLTDDNAYLIKTEEKEICSPEMHWISGFYHGQLFPRLGKEQIKQAVNHMYYVMNHYDEAKNKAQKLKNLVLSEYTWEVTAENVSKRIKEIYQEG